MAERIPITITVEATYYADPNNYEGDNVTANDIALDIDNSLNQGEMLVEEFLEICDPESIKISAISGEPS